MSGTAGEEFMSDKVGNISFQGQEFTHCVLHFFKFTSFLGFVANAVQCVIVQACKTAQQFTINVIFSTALLKPR